jgi:hypothetical protein
MMKKLFIFGVSLPTKPNYKEFESSFVAKPGALSVIHRFFFLRNMCTIMKTKISIILVVFLAIQCSYNRIFSQIEPEGNAYVLAFLPNKKKNIYGLAIGLIGSESYCSYGNIRTSHGLNLQLLGSGWFVVLSKQFWNPKLGFGNDSIINNVLNDETQYRVRHNGLLLSSLGTNTSISNGLSISGVVSNGMTMNGIAFNLLSNNYMVSNGVAISLLNRAYKANGIQVGIINKSKYLKGIQIGLWNVNSKRRMPLINWCFREKT